MLFDKFDQIFIALYIFTLDYIKYMENKANYNSIRTLYGNAMSTSAKPSKNSEIINIFKVQNKTVINHKENFEMS